MPDMNLRYRVPPKIVDSFLFFTGQDMQNKKWRVFILFGVILATCGLIGMLKSILDTGLSSKTLFWSSIMLSTSFVELVGCYWFMRYLSRKISEEWGEISLSMQEEGLRLAQAGAQTLYFWSYLREVRVMPTTTRLREAPTWLAVIMNSMQGIVIPIPLAAFADEHEKQAFIAAIEAKMAAHAQTPVAYKSCRT
jgi:hypothetical protein